MLRPAKCGRLWDGLGLRRAFGREGARQVILVISHVSTVRTPFALGLGVLVSLWVPVLIGNNCPYPALVLSGWPKRACPVAKISHHCLPNTERVLSSLSSSFEQGSHTRIGISRYFYGSGLADDGGWGTSTTPSPKRILAKGSSGPTLNQDTGPAFDAWSKRHWGGGGGGRLITTQHPVPLIRNDAVPERVRISSLGQGLVVRS
ncbi:hypothetical protein VUR80DRAFT_495 [Thermomyces stellatus]